MKRFIAIVAALALLGLTGGLLAQTANHTVNVAANAFQVIRVSSGSAITMTIVAPTSGNEGTAAPDVTDNTQYLQYTVIKAPSTTYKVTGRISAGTMPTGLTLYVGAATPGAGGAGTKGTGAGEKTLSGTAQDLVTGIASCYTANGASDGSRLTYRLSVTDWTNVASAASTAMTVTYTITT